jgi:hypothetical protein
MSPARDSWSPLPVVLRAGRKCGLLQGPAMLAGRPGDPGAGHLFATDEGAWSGAAADRRVQSSGRPRRAMTNSELASGCAGLAHPVSARQRISPSRRP